MLFLNLNQELIHVSIDRDCFLDHFDSPARTTSLSRPIGFHCLSLFGFSVLRQARIPLTGLLGTGRVVSLDIARIAQSAVCIDFSL